MTPSTILVRLDCDLRRLPINAKEAFFVSQLDGNITLEEASEIAGLGMEEVIKLAGRLTILGAVKDKESRAPAENLAAQAKASRVDPRAEAASTPGPPRNERLASRRSERRTSTRSMRAVRPSPTSNAAAVAPKPAPAAKVEEVCELDGAGQEKILSMDAKIRGQTHYDVLGVERTTDKKDIKRAYFALAASFHPDRFFGKKLGPLRAPLDRIFIRLTEANDALGTNARRAAYDATLPPAPAPAPTAPASPEKKPSAARRMSKRMRKSQLTPAVVVDKPVDPPPTPICPPPVSVPPVSAPPASAPESPDKFRRLQAVAQSMAGATRAQALIKAAEDAVRSGDIVGAANNYRLALQMHDDPAIRQKLDAIDAHSRDLRHEKYLVRARGAERAERWDAAAENYIRANEARKEATCAERAAYALRLSKGDLRTATSLAEQAVAHDGKNAEYRVTLGEVYFAAGFMVRAKEECEVATSLAPSNARAKTLAAAIRERS